MGLLYLDIKVLITTTKNINYSTRISFVGYIHVIASFYSTRGIFLSLLPNSQVSLKFSPQKIKLNIPFVCGKSSGDPSCCTSEHQTSTD